jgi:hypothetical protein
MVMMLAHKAVVPAKRRRMLRRDAVGTPANAPGEGGRGGHG